MLELPKLEQGNWFTKQEQEWLLTLKKEFDNSNYDWRSIFKRLFSWSVKETNAFLSKLVSEKEELSKSNPDEYNNLKDVFLSLEKKLEEMSCWTDVLSDLWDVYSDWKLDKWLLEKFIKENKENIESNQNNFWIHVLSVLFSILANCPEEKNFLEDIILNSLKNIILLDDTDLNELLYHIRDFWEYFSNNYNLKLAQKLVLEKSINLKINDSKNVKYIHHLPYIISILNNNELIPDENKKALLKMTVWNNIVSKEAIFSSLLEKINFGNDSLSKFKLNDYIFDELFDTLVKEKDEKSLKLLLWKFSPYIQNMNISTLNRLLDKIFTSNLEKETKLSFMIDSLKDKPDYLLVYLNNVLKDNKQNQIKYSEILFDYFSSFIGKFWEKSFQDLYVKFFDSAFSSDISYQMRRFWVLRKDREWFLKQDKSQKDFIDIDDKDNKKYEEELAVLRNYTKKSSESTYLKTLDSKELNKFPKLKNFFSEKKNETDFSFSISLDTLFDGKHDKELSYLESNYNIISNWEESSIDKVISWLSNFDLSNWLFRKNYLDLFFNIITKNSKVYKKTDDVMESVYVDKWIKKLIRYSDYIVNIDSNKEVYTSKFEKDIFDTGFWRSFLDKINKNTNKEQLKESFLNLLKSSFKDYLASWSSSKDLKKDWSNEFYKIFNSNLNKLWADSELKILINSEIIENNKFKHWVVEFLNRWLVYYETTFNNETSKDGVLKFVLEDSNNLSEKDAQSYSDYIHYINVEKKYTLLSDTSNYDSLYLWYLKFKLNQILLIKWVNKDKLKELSNISSKEWIVNFKKSFDSDFEIKNSIAYSQFDSALNNEIWFKDFLSKANGNKNLQDIFLNYNKKVEAAWKKINHAKEVLSNPNMLKQEEKSFQSSYIYNLYLQNPNQAWVIAKANWFDLNKVISENNVSQDKINTISSNYNDKVFVPEKINYNSSNQISNPFYKEWVVGLNKIIEWNWLLDLNRNLFKEFLKSNWVNINFFNLTQDEIYNKFWIDFNKELTKDDFDKVIKIYGKKVVENINTVNGNDLLPEHRKILETLKKDILLNPLVWMKEFFDYMLSNSFIKDNFYKIFFGSSENMINRVLSLDIISSFDKDNINDFYKNSKVN